MNEILPLQICAAGGLENNMREGVFPRADVKFNMTPNGEHKENRRGLHTGRLASEFFTLASKF